MSSYTAYTSSQNEGAYGFNPHEAAMQAAARSAADARLDSVVARFDAIRAAWNTAVAKYTVNGQLSMAALKRIESEVGVTRTELLSAKARIGA